MHIRADGSGDLKARLDAWKARLIDLGKRNRLLYFRESRRGTLRLEGPSIEELWAHLSREGAEIAFAPREEEGEPADDAPGATDTPGGALTVRTALTQAELERTLTNLYRKSRESVAELGVHTLHLALGFLHWHESESSDEEIASPLLLMPAELVRKRGGGMLLLGLGDPLVVNIALAEKLRRDFSLELPRLGTPESPLPSPTVYLADVDFVAGRLPRSSVREGAVLALLSFAKLVMYEDLGRSADRALSNPIVRGLCGQVPPDREWDVAAGESLDQRIPYEDSFEVLDADASQREAIAAARNRHSFVLVGPPGTGKSQTIANIIAAMIADQRRVLFVSEKRAALEVVEARLRECGLTQFCLNLHKFRGGKREILDQLEGRLRGADEPKTARLVDFAQAELCRRGLDEYAEQLHTPFGAAELTPYEVHGRLCSVAGAPALPFELSRPVADLDAEWFAQAEALLGEAETVSHVYQEGELHPWWGFRPPVRDPGEREDLRGHLEGLQRVTARVSALAAEIAAALALPAPSSVRHASGLAQGLGALARLRPGITQPHWAGRPSPDGLVELATEAQSVSVALAAARGALDSVYQASLYADDLGGLCERFAQYRRRWWGRVWKSRRDVKVLRRHLRGPGTRRAFVELAADVERLVEVRKQEQWFGDADAELRVAFGDAYSGPDTDWEALLADLGAVTELKGVLAAECTPEWLRARLEGLRDLPVDLETKRRRLVEAIDEVTGLIAWFRQCFAERFDPFGRTDTQDLGLVRLGEWVGRGLGRLADAGDWQELNRLGRRAHDLGVTNLHGLLVTSPKAAAQPGRAFRKRLCLLWLRAAYAERRALAGFGLRRMEQLVTMFRELDVAAVGSGSRRVRGRAVHLGAGAAAGEGSGQVAVLKREIRRRRPRPIRQLLEEIPELVQALTPCMLMSPLSVSQYLASERLLFDLVIFDEASQVKPEDAITAILRGRALVVAGDPKQLPPTTFFEATLSEDYDEDATEETLESILDECDTWLREVPLRWHYRSRDDSLIAFSNHHFYRNRLVTFPNAERAELDLGPRFVFCTEGVYDRSRSRTNRNEARTVAVLLGELHKRYPGDSLGVVALSQAQQEAIQDAIEDLARGDSMYERLLSAAEEPEGLFVKNLETVQGDERDTIILSVGYGRDETGRLHTNFGPLNREGGERRLNVAVSRARNRVVVVSSIKADDLPRTGSRGIVLLREYLEYAEKGPGTLASAADGGLDEGESPFEEAVRAALVDRGLDMRAQVGCGAYRVDLAVVDPEHPGRYLLGIECDGATYHSARTARDRDRLRQQVLERLGWRTVRIWSTDWVKDPERQIARVVEEVAKARALPDARPEGIPAVSAEGVAGAEPAIGPDPPAPEEARADAEPGAAVAEAAPHVYRAAELGVVGTSDSFYALAEARDPSFLSLVVKVVEVESPVHKDVVARRLTTAFGMKHCGAKIQRLVTQSIVALSRRGTLRIQRGFAWAREPRPVVVRTNAGASEVRSPEHIAAEEVREAVLKVVSESFGVGRDECAAGVARAFGFERAGARIREWAIKAVDAAVREGAVEVVGEGTLVLPRR